jgi:hypothetical protein
MQTRASRFALSTETEMVSLVFRKVYRGYKLARNYQLLGWILFIISAIGFIVSSIRSGDLPGLIGGIFFLLACLAFLIPFVKPDARD